MSDPIALFKDKWGLAKDKRDASASFCTLAIADAAGKVSMRTLVLRDVNAGGFVVYVNRTSSKWPSLTNGLSLELLVFWPSLMRQYRIRGEYSELSPETMVSHWARKPYESKLLDHYYAQHPQSSVVESRDVLIKGLSVLRERYPNSDAIPYIEDATGVVIAPNYIESWCASEDNHIHQRILSSLTKNGWVDEILVP
jgi:pyridoxine/pyridoxamine 5'-phosphate oxidase